MKGRFCIRKVRSVNESIKIILPCLQGNQRSQTIFFVTKREFRIDQRSQTSSTDGNSQTQKQMHEQMNEACCINYFECSGRNAWRTSPSNIWKLIFAWQSWMKYRSATNKMMLKSEDFIFLPKCVTTVRVHKVPLFKHNRPPDSYERVLQGGSKITVGFSSCC